LVRKCRRHGPSSVEKLHHAHDETGEFEQTFAKIEWFSRCPV
jgi:hypothetical protein